MVRSVKGMFWGLGAENRWRWRPALKREHLSYSWKDEEDSTRGGRLRRRRTFQAMDGS